MTLLLMIRFSKCTSMGIILLPCAELRASSARIAPHLIITGHNDFFGKHTAGQGRRPELVFDDPVFKRVECDHNDAAAGTNDSHRRIQEGFKALEFLIDKNPQSLKGPSRRVDLSVPLAATDALNRAGKIKSGL